MNILYLTNHLNIGGITSYTLTLASGMKKRGHNIYIASSSGEVLPRFTAEGIVYLPLPVKTKSEISLGVLVGRYKLLKYIRENKIDILHANTRVTQVLGFFIRRAASLPYVSTCHGFFKKRLFRKILPCWGDKTIAISEQVKEHLVADFGLSDKNIRVIHSAVDTGKFKIPDPKLKGEAKRRLGLGDGPAVGIVARLSREKGHVYLIRAMRQVIARVPAAQLLIVGDGRLKKELTGLVRAENLERNIFFHSAVKDTLEVLEAMDLFVLPSLKEGLGLALMEAMACGLAVIGSDVGGIKSLIRDGQNGLLVRPEDHQGLAEAISVLLRDPDKARSLGDNARLFINENFSQEKMVSQTEEVYSECLRERS
ncbi:MAG: glycosyltransferase family 4 protein [Candidatus Omnitrophica bacterium]|nr:glycosyltransferase family 4 protein [Candidatus Omnitrophota bacterium]